MYKGQMEQPLAKFHCKLVVWERAIELCAAVYALTCRFPREELYGLTNQIRRASISIPSNIAEGYGRGTGEQYKYFLAVALGSSMELQTQLVIAGKLGFATSGELENVQRVASEVGRMLSATESAMCSLEITPTICDGRHRPPVVVTTAMLASWRAIRCTTSNTISFSRASVKLRCAMLPRLMP